MFEQKNHWVYSVSGTKEGVWHLTALDGDHKSYTPKNFLVNCDRIYSLFDACMARNAL